MAQKSFPASWVGVYRASSNSYAGGINIRGGGSNQSNTYIGIPASVKDALESSKTTPKLYFKMNVTNPGEFDFGAHKESYNKAGGTMPWYRYIGLHPNYGTGWQTTNLTSDFMNDFLRGTYDGIVIYGASSNEVVAHGRTGDSNQAVFIVDGTWNAPPKTPGAFTNPKASTVATTTVALAWGAGSDEETPVSDLSYELGFYNGSKWANSWTVAKGIRSYNFSLAGKPETSRAKFRVRSVDPQGLKSGWRESPYFRINHNKAPAKPTKLTPVGGKIVLRDSTIRATWKHNDDGVQAGYRLAWRTVASNGTTGAWTHIPSYTGWANSTSSYHDFSPNTFPLGEIEWNVKTKDQQGLESPWSAHERFYAGEVSDAPIWLTPLSGDILNSSTLVADWSSLDQERYQIELYSSAGVKLWSEDETASNKSTLIGYALENNQTYTLKIRVINKLSGLWSSYSEVTFDTQFIPPVKPLLDIQTMDTEGNSLDVVSLSWQNDDTDQPTPTSYIQIFRREYNALVEQPWTMLADNQAPNNSMTDYTPASDQVYEYMARAWGENKTFSDSDIKEVIISLSNSFLQKANSPADLLVMEVEERDQEFSMSGAMMLFANRQKPVFEFGIHEQVSLPIKFYIESIAEFRSIVNFLRTRETFLYRDNVGRRLFCTISDFSVKDLAVNGFEISLTLNEVDRAEFVQGGA